MRQCVYPAAGRVVASLISNRRMWVSAPRENNALVPTSGIDDFSPCRATITLSDPVETLNRL